VPPADNRPGSTTDAGNAFRDAVATLLRSAGYEVRTEVQAAGKNVDIFAVRKQRFKRERLALEAKDYASNLPSHDTQQFVYEYGSIVRSGEADHGILVTRGDVTPQGKRALEAAARDGLLHFTWENFQREIFAPDPYLRALVREHEEAGTQGYYVPTRSGLNEDLMEVVRAWIAEDKPPPLVILGGYGTGKSTFARTLACDLAVEALRDPAVRLPVLVPLGEIAEENSLDGLFGKLFASRYRVDGYHYDVFRELNRLGRLLIILDGFDEMKHGMTFPVFQRECDRLFSLHEGDARVMLLGRPNAFPSDREFRAVIKGKVTTATGDEIGRPGRPECRDVRLREWTEEEARAFVSRFFPYLAGKQDGGPEWIAERLALLLSDRFSGLRRRPVHAQMLCQVALDPAADLEGIDEFRLYDSFITLLLQREVAKPGRYPRFDIAHRRRFNGAVSWWLMTHGGASSTTLLDVPDHLCRAAVHDTSHDLDREGLKRELVAGCLIEKGGSTVYFGHRSTQEFLAAEHLFETAMLTRGDHARDPVSEVCAHATPEVAEFAGEFFARHPDGAERAAACCDRLAVFEGSLPLASLRPFIRPFEMQRGAGTPGGPWPFLLDYLARFPAGRWVPAQGDHLLGALRNRSTGRPTWLAAAQQIAIECALGQPVKPAALLAVLVETSGLVDFIAEARRTSKPVYINVGNHAAFCLVNALSFRDAGPGGRLAERPAAGEALVFRPDRLYRTARKLLGYGPTLPSGDARGDPEAAAWTVVPQQLYGELGWKNHALERLRPFFNDARVCRLIRPVEIVDLESRQGRRAAVRSALPRTRDGFG